MSCEARWFWTYGILCVFTLGCGARSAPVVIAPPVVERPPTVPDPAPAPLDPFHQRGDFRSFWCGDTFYILGDQPDPRAECLAEYHAQGYRDVWVTVTRDGGLPGIAPFDYLADVPRFRALAQQFLDAGLRVHPVLGCEDAEAMCRDHHGPFPAWLARVGLFIEGTKDLATSYVFGVEIREWATWDQSLEMVRVAASQHVPAVLHFNQGIWGPSATDPWSGGGQLAYWTRVLAIHRGVALGLQYHHDSVEDTGGGFLSTIPEVDRQTRAIVARLAPLGVPIIASEYAYRMPEDQAALRGRMALAVGAVGCMNGC